MESAGGRDAGVERLARLFREHPAWVAAAGHLGADATSNVYFDGRPGEGWRLEKHPGGSRLLPGVGDDPDFVFRFTPASVARLEAVRGGVGEFAVELFALILEEEPDLRVGFRIAAGFPRLARRGYLRLLLAAGPRVLAFGAAHGIRTLRGLRRFVAEQASAGPQPWEVEPADRP
jgi:hypothetical protein